MKVEIRERSAIRLMSMKSILSIMSIVWLLSSRNGSYGAYVAYVVCLTPVFRLSPLDIGYSVLDIGYSVLSLFLVSCLPFSDFRIILTPVS